MTDILTEIAGRTKERLEAKKMDAPIERVIERAKALGPGSGSFPFEDALRRRGLSFICEVKRASPSKGMISENFPYMDIAREYEEAGADAISVLTEPYYFKGDDRYLEEIAARAGIPLLRKDFVVDSYMVYEAKALGADAALLICSILSGGELAEYIGIADELGLSALVEAHDEDEVAMALSAGARIIGVNNRDLKTFNVDISLSARLRGKVPEGVLFVSESGISSPEDVEMMRKIGADAVLIGESVMRSEDRVSAIKRLRGKNHG